ncbi:MAG: nitrile hydratase subunit beta [Rhodospirillales bacterium]|nr:nitrile hydratase subunit beta [Rhodospirillales bacterium]
MSRSDPAVFPLPARDGEPLFADVWEAQALGIAHALIEAGHLTNTEWSQALDAVRTAQAAEDLADRRKAYYLAAVGALERLLSDKGLIPAQDLRQRKADWIAAYGRTPHGKPILLNRRAHSNQRWDPIPEADR